MTIIAAISGILLLLVLMGALALYLARREPYSTFLRLPTRRKLAVLKALFLDRRVPLWAKAVIPLMLLYLSMPFDLVPDFIPLLGYIDDVALVVLALALFLRLCPRQVLEEHMQMPSTPPHPHRPHSS